MLKLTRGALTMLLKEYRSILKNAYIKNIAAGALLAGSLTVSSNAYADPAPVSCENEGKCTVAGDETLAVPSNSLNSFTELTIEAKVEGTSANDGKVTITEGNTLTATTITNSGDIAVGDGSAVAGIQTSSLTNNGKITTASGDELTITGKFEAGEASATSQDSEGKYFKTKTDNYGDLAVVVNKESAITNAGTLTIGALSKTVSDKDDGDHSGSEEGKAFTITTNAVGKQTFSAEATVENGATVKNEATGELYLNAASTIYANALENAGNLFINANSTIDEFKNTGNITVGDADLADKNITANLTSTAPADDFDVIASGKSLTVKDGATVNFNKSDAGDKVLSNAGNIEVEAGATLNTDDFVNDGGSVTVNGTFTTAGLLNGFGLNEDSFKDGEISDPTKLVAGEPEKNATLTVNGTLTVNEASLNRGTINIANSSVH